MDDIKPRMTCCVCGCVCVCVYSTPSIKQVCSTVKF